MRTLLWLMLGLGACSAVKTRQNLRATQAEWTGFSSESLTLGPHTVHHWIGGEGPTVLLIHGFGADGLATWWPQARHLAKDHRVIVPDLLWFGESSSSAPPTLDAQAGAIQALVDHHVDPGESVDVVGISYGGFVALRYGSLDPERQRKLVILDSPGPLFDSNDQAALLARFGVDAPEDIFVPKDSEAVRVLIELAYHKPPPLPDALLRDIQRQVFSAHLDEKTTLLRELESEAERYQGAQPAQYTDTLIIWGEHDTVFPLDIGRSLAEHMNAGFLVVEDTAHAPHLERPQEVNEVLSAFLKP